jgi:phosphoglycerate dehydrogenase-like enzyme
MKNIVILISVDGAHRKILESRAPGASFIYGDSCAIDLADVRHANAIIGNPPLAFLKEARDLEWLQLVTAGVDSYTQAGVLTPGAVLTNASGAFGLAVSEYMLGVLLELFKRLHYYRDNQRAENWTYEGQVKSIDRSTILIVGVGDIGGEFAKRVKALGAYTLGIRRTNLDKPDYLDELDSLDRLPDLLPRADAVVLSLPDTQQTRKIINAETIQLMKPDAVLINAGRGSSVDTDDLCDALEAERIWGAALDVFDPEPLPPGHRLWRLKNVVITPHISGGRSLPEIYEKTIQIIAANLEAFVTGKTMSNLVDRSAGY